LDFLNSLSPAQEKNDSLPRTFSTFSWTVDAINQINEMRLVFTTPWHPKNPNCCRSAPQDNASLGQQRGFHEQPKVDHYPAVNIEAPRLAQAILHQFAPTAEQRVATQASQPKEQSNPPTGHSLDQVFSHTLFEDPRAACQADCIPPRSSSLPRSNPMDALSS
jgi:hypothetical protein